MLILQDVSKNFNRTTAVDNLSFEVSEGSIFGLLGPNGAGKTTTIRMIMNILKPDSGTILFKGDSFKKGDYQKVGYLPEERGLYQKMKLKETVIYLGRLKGLSGSKAARQTDEFLERFELTDYANRKIEELSKGNQQKVQFIVSIIHDPILLILDEPFVGLDPVNQLLLKEIIGELKDKGATIIFSTHQMEQVEKLCNQICLINNGKKVLYGNLREIKKEYGTQIVTIEFEGEKETLEDLKSLRNLRLEDNSLTGEMPEGIFLNDVLIEVMNHVSVTHFHLLEPSLEQIFIDQVKEEGRP